MSCGSSSDGDNIIIIKPGTLKTPNYQIDSDVSDSDEDIVCGEVKNNSAKKELFNKSKPPTAPKR